MLDKNHSLTPEIKIPEPVFFCSIEAPSSSKQNVLDQALANLQKEDPSFSVSFDKNSGQTVISGMGELHIEVSLFILSFFDSLLMKHSPRPFVFCR